MTTIITMLGGPRDGEEFEVTSVGDTRGYIVVLLDNLRDYNPVNPSSDDSVKTFHVPIQLTSRGKYIANWNEAVNG